MRKFGFTQVIHIHFRDIFNEKHGFSIKKKSQKRLEMTQIRPKSQNGLKFKKPWPSYEGCHEETNNKNLNLTTRKF